MNRSGRFVKFLTWILSLILAQPMNAFAATPWDEKSAVAAFLNESPLVAMLRAEADIARAGLAGTGIWPNPDLQASREQVFSTAGGADENRLGLQVPFLLGEKVVFARSVASAAIAVAGARAAVKLNGYVAEFRESLSLAHFAQSRGEALSAAASAYERVAKVVRARVGAGEEAPYDLNRVRLASAGLAGRIAAQDSDAREALATLSGLLGRPVRGAIGLSAPEPDLPEDSGLAVLVEANPTFRALLDERRRSLAKRGLAELQSWPDPTLSIGFMQAGGGLGYTAGIAWPLPIFNRAQGDLALADAEAAWWLAEEAALKRRLTGEISGAMAALRSRQEAALTYDRDTSALIPDLIRGAETAYREGQGTILGVLDAHEAALAAKFEHLELLEGAQKARIRLDRLLGTPFALPVWRKS